MKEFPSKHITGNRYWDVDAYFILLSAVCMCPILGERYKKDVTTEQRIEWVSSGEQKTEILYNVFPSRNLDYLKRNAKRISQLDYYKLADMHSLFKYACEEIPERHRESIYYDLVRILFCSYDEDEQKVKKWLVLFFQLPADRVAIIDEMALNYLQLYKDLDKFQ